MTKYTIFDLNGMVAFFDHAESKADAISKLATEDDCYSGIDELRVHELNEEEAAQLSTWIDAGQKTHEWPFDWRA